MRSTRSIKLGRCVYAFAYFVVVVSTTLTFFAFSQSLSSCYVEQGTYGSVFVGQDKSTREIVALKRINTEQEENGFPITAIREVKILKALRHVNIVNLKEIVTSKGAFMLLFVLYLAEIKFRVLLRFSTKQYAVLSAYKKRSFYHRSCSLLARSVYKLSTVFVLWLWSLFVL